MRRRDARELLALVLDPGSFESWDAPIDLFRHAPAYREVLEAAALRSGTDESVLTGRGLVHGRPVAVVVNEFGFLGGSIGTDAAARIACAVRRATREHLPLLATTASGGTRMQEGTLAFLQMVEISRAVMAHRAGGLPYLVYLRNPTTGGVFASWGSLAHVTVAEPGALIGFLGPRVIQSLNGEPLPSGVQVAENLAAKGVIDGVVAPEDIAGLVDRLLSVLTDPPTPPTLPHRTGDVRSDGRAWDSIARTRAAGRAGARDLLRFGSPHTVWLSGTDEGERDEHVLLALTRLDGQPCVVVAQDRTRQTGGSRMGPAALRVARRGMSLAQELGLPLLTVIDTPGAQLSKRAEEGAIAGEIARCMAQLMGMTVPTLAVLLGQGSGGAALALFPARRAIAAEHAWLAPLPPEGASTIVHGHPRRAAEVAEAQHVRATDLLAAGVIRDIVPERADDGARSLAHAVIAASATHLWEMAEAQGVADR